MTDHPTPDSRARSTVRAYSLAVVASAASIALTRFAWPLFEGTPFIPLFAGVVVATMWGSRGAGQLAIVVSLVGSTLAVPPDSGEQWTPRALIVFAVVALIVNLVVDGRNRTQAALRASLAAQRRAEQELRESEEHLRRAQKTEAVARLVAGVAHNFNNVLTVVAGYTELLIRRSEGQTADRHDLEKIRSATTRGATLTRQLLAFGRRHDAVVKRFDIMSSVAGLGEMLARVIREDIRLAIDVEREPAHIELDPNDFQQVVLNLVLNARDALPSGGVIELVVDRRQVDSPARVQGQSIAPGEYACLRVHDNGVGMTPEVEAHLFEPFFTTKDVGQGTGLGLAFVYGIARQRGGYVTVDTAPGQGTTVSVSFPLEPAVPLERMAASERKAVVRRNATILLVEDEGDVRSATAGLLATAGYRVLPAATPTEASALFERHASEIDLLVTDVVMPEMHGPALAEQLVARRPDLRVLYVSGHRDSMPTGATARGQSAFLAKPFQSSSLVGAVSDLLG